MPRRRLSSSSRKRHKAAAKSRRRRKLKLSRRRKKVCPPGKTISRQTGRCSIITSAGRRRLRSGGCLDPNKRKNYNNHCAYTRTFQRKRYRSRKISRCNSKRGYHWGRKNSRMIYKNSRGRYGYRTVSIQACVPTKKLLASRRRARNRKRASAYRRLFSKARPYRSRSSRKRSRTRKSVQRRVSPYVTMDPAELVAGYAL